MKNTDSGFVRDVSKAIAPWLDHGIPFVDIEPILHALLPCFSSDDAKKLFSKELLCSWGVN